jgi:hypothetical protein
MARENSRWGYFRIRGEQTFNQRIAADEATHDVASEKRHLSGRIQFGKTAEQRLKRIPFPSTMANDVAAYVTAIETNRHATQKYIDATDDSGRENAVLEMNKAGREEDNIIYKVRADLGLPLQACPYTGP